MQDGDVKCEVLKFETLNFLVLQGKALQSSAYTPRLCPPLASMEGAGEEHRRQQVLLVYILQTFVGSKGVRNSSTAPSASDFQESDVSLMPGGISEGKWPLSRKV